MTFFRLAASCAGAKAAPAACLVSAVSDGLRVLGPAPARIVGERRHGMLVHGRVKVGVGRHRVVSLRFHVAHCAFDTIRHDVGVLFRR